MSKSKSIFFLSDTHLGAHGKAENPHRILLLCNFLQRKAPYMSHLILLGDIFEFWMEYQYYIPKIHFSFLHTLKNLTDVGVKIHYLSGNHDFNLGTFFSDQLKIEVHHKPVTLTLQSKKVYLIHGDGMIDSDWKYRFLKKIITHPFSNWTFKWIHPDYGMKLANFVGSMSRQNRCSAIKTDYIKACETYLTSAHDAVIFGHIHQPFIESRAGGSIINTGDWIFHNSYIELNSGRFEVHHYRSER